MGAGWHGIRARRAPSSGPVCLVVGLPRTNRLRHVDQAFSENCDNLSHPMPGTYSSASQPPLAVLASHAHVAGASCPDEFPEAKEVHVKPTFLTTTSTKTWRHGGRGNVCARWPARTMQLSKEKADRERPSALENDDTSISWGLGSVNLPPPHSATFQGRYCMSNAWRTGGHQSTRQARTRDKRLWDKRTPYWSQKPRARSRLG